MQITKEVKKPTIQTIDSIRSLMRDRLTDEKLKEKEGIIIIKI